MNTLITPESIKDLEGILPQPILNALGHLIFYEPESANNGTAEHAAELSLLATYFVHFFLDKKANVLDKLAETLDVFAQYGLRIEVAADGRIVSMDGNRSLLSPKIQVDNQPFEELDDLTLEDYYGPNSSLVQMFNLRTMVEAPLLVETIADHAVCMYQDSPAFNSTTDLYSIVVLSFEGPVQERVREAEMLFEAQVEIGRLVTAKQIHELKAAITAYYLNLGLITKGVNLLEEFLDKEVLTDAQSEKLKNIIKVQTSGANQLRAAFDRLHQKLVEILEEVTATFTESQTEFNPSSIKRKLEYFLTEQKRNQVMKQGVSVDFYCDVDQETVLSGNETYIFLVLEQFILNALRFTQSGTINVNLSQVSGYGYILQVTNPGSELPEGVGTADLTQAGYSNNTAIGQPKGTGKGLFLAQLSVKRLVETSNVIQSAQIDLQNRDDGVPGVVSSLCVQTE